MIVRIDTLERRSRTWQCVVRREARCGKSKYAAVAQQVEHGSEEPGVDRSIRSRGTIEFGNFVTSGVKILTFYP